jgi:hypothetical protein
MLLTNTTADTRTIIPRLIRTLPTKNIDAEETSIKTLS